MIVGEIAFGVVVMGGVVWFSSVEIRAFIRSYTVL